MNSIISPDAGHQRAVFITSSNAPASQSLDSFLTRRKLKAQRVSQTGPRYFSFKETIKVSRNGDGRFKAASDFSEITVPTQIVNRFKTRANEICVDAVITEFRDAKLRGFFVASPFIQMLSLIFDLQKQYFFRADLRKICNDQFSGPLDEKIKITRLNCKLEGELHDQVSKLTFFGTSIIKAAVLKDVLGLVRNSKTVITPFNKSALSEHSMSRFLDPMSCRLKWDDGTDNAFSLNLDRFGNYSFYFRNVNALAPIQQIHKYFAEINSLSESSIDPLVRSDTALQEIMV